MSFTEPILYLQRSTISSWPDPLAEPKSARCSSSLLNVQRSPHTMPEPLPDRNVTLEKFLGWNEQELIAYDLCFRSEQTATSSDNIRFARILGHLLILAPNSKVRNELAQWIYLCQESDEQIYAVGEFIQTYLIRPCKSMFMLICCVCPVSLSSSQEV